VHEPPIDETVLEGLQLLRRDGRPDLAQTVIMLFLESAPASLKDLAAGAAKDDVLLLHRAAHILKSSSVAVGARVMSAHCEQLETIARSGTVPDAAARVQTILECYREAEGALRAWCAVRE
jgi:HPt (histidine-containing phosphotransfer) domain-containing protein